MTTNKELSKKTDVELEAEMAKQLELLSSATKAAEALLAKKNKITLEVKTVDTVAETKELPGAEKEAEVKISENKETTKNNKDEDLKSEYHDKALEIIKETGNTTFSNLQKKLKIPANKAKRLLEIFEQEGILGPSIKGAPREILKKEGQEEEKKNINKPEKPETAETKETSDKEKDIEKNSISNKQKIRNAEEEIRKISRDEKNINEKKTALINSGYLESDALKMAELMDVISGDEKRKEILINNPGIQNGQKELSIVEKRLAENKILLDELKTKTINPNPQNPGGKNQKVVEKENAIKIAKDKLLGFFRRKEKQKIEVYTEEEENAWMLMIKAELEKGKSKEEVRALILSRSEEKNRLELEKGPLSPRIKSGISNGIKNWDNWGNEGGTRGFFKKTGKMVLSLGLIIGSSTVSVEGMATLGIGTASALGTGAVAKKLFMGLGFGTAMSLLGTMSPEKAKKVGKVFRICMPAISIGVALATGGGALAGAAIGGAAAFGYISSQLVQKRFSEEKIQTKLDTIKNREININTFEEDVRNALTDTQKILKQAENIRLYRKLLGGLAAVAGSVAVLEASGYVHDLKTEHQESEQQKIEEFNAKHEVNVKHLEEMEQKHQQHVEEMKQRAEYAEQQVKNDSETQTDQTEANNQTPETETNNVTQNPNIQEFMKSTATQDAIKLGMYTPGEANESMNVQSGTISFDSPGHHVEVPYSSDGAIQTIIDLKNAMADEFGGEEKIPSGNMTTHYVDMNGIEHDQALIYHDTNGVEVVDNYNGTMFDSDNSSNVNSPDASEIQGQVEVGTDLSTDENLPRVEIDPETGLLIETDDSDKTTGLDQNINNGENTIEKDAENISEIKLTPDMLEQVERTSEYNIDRVFPTDEAINQWYNIQTMEATLVTDMNVDDADEIYKPLVEYVHNLQRITGITNPHEATWTQPAESIKEYIERALEKAASDPKIGLDKVTL